MNWSGCQNNPIDVNFHLQKCLEIFEKKADKIDPKRTWGLKYPLPYKKHEKIAKKKNKELEN